MSTSTQPPAAGQAAPREYEPSYYVTELKGGSRNLLASTPSGNWRIVARFDDDAEEREAEKIGRACDSHAALVALVSRAQSILAPNALWTKAETARSWKAWQDDARAALARAKEGK